MSQIFDNLIAHYGWQGVALVGVILILFSVQFYYYLIAYRRVSAYRNSRRKKLLEQEPPISIVVTLFSEDYNYLDERLPLLFQQEYEATYEVVLVYVGCDGDFYEELQRLRLAHPNLGVTKFDFNPRFPISVKQAINLGIKSSHNEHVILTTTSAAPASAQWLAMMGKAFMRGGLLRHKAREGVGKLHRANVEFALLALLAGAGGQSRHLPRHTPQYWLYQGALFWREGLYSFEPQYRRG